MELTQNPSVLELVRKTAELTTPKEIVWIDGSEAQLESLRKIAVETGELIKLNEEKLPGCYLNRSDVNDVARVEGRTFICSRTREEAGPTNNWMDPDEMKAKLHEILRGAMAGRTMYVIPYSMGVIGSPFAKYGIEVTDSIYVVLNMAIMTRIGTKVLEALGDSSDVILGVHSKVTLDPENATSSTSRRRTRSSPSTPTTVATCCRAKSASRCALPPCSAAARGGWLSTCSSSASRIPRAKCVM